MGVFKNKRNVFVLIFFVASLLYVLYLLIFNNNNKDVDNNIKGYTKEQVDIYTVKENIIKDYNKFYTLEDISTQIISALKEGKYSEVYSLVSSDMVGGISKEQWLELLKNFYTDNFSNFTDGDGEEVQYEISRNLVNSYGINSDTYILEVRNNHNSTTRIGIKYVNNVSYKIVYIEF